MALALTITLAWTLTLASTLTLYLTLTLCLPRPISWKISARPPRPRTHTLRLSRSAEV